MELNQVEITKSGDLLHLPYLLIDKDSHPYQLAGKFSNHFFRLLREDVSFTFRIKYKSEGICPIFDGTTSVADIGDAADLNAYHFFPP